MRVVVAEDQFLTRAGIVGVLGAAGVDVVGEAADVDGLIRLVRTRRPDVALVDVRMPPTHTSEGLAAAVRIRTEVPETSVVILSQHIEPAYAMELLEGGGERSGYLLKDRILEPQTLVDALRRVIAGECVVDPAIVTRLLRLQRRTDPLGELTPREREVLALIAEGCSNEAIAARLVVAERTVEVHSKQIFAKLGLGADAAGNRRVLAVLAFLRAAS